MLRNHGEFLLKAGYHEKLLQMNFKWTLIIRILQ